MGYNIDFSICACIIIFSVLVSYYSKKNIPILQNNAFILLAWFAFFAALTDTLSGLVGNNSDLVPHSINYLVNFLCLFFNNGTSFLFAIYCIAITDTIKTMNNAAKAVLVVFATIDVIIIGLTPILDWAFYIDKYNRYTRQNAIYVLYVTATGFLIFGAVYIHFYRNIVDKDKRKAIRLFIIISMFTVLIQLFLPHILLQGFGIAICIMLIYSNIQRLQELQNAEINTLNEIAFEQMLKSRFGGNNMFYIVIIHIADAEFLRNSVGVAQLNSLLKSIAEYIHRLSYKSLLYIADTDKFFLSIDERDYKCVKELLEEAKKRFIEPWKCGDMETILHTHICLIKCPSDAKNVQHILDYAHCLNSESHEDACGIFYAEQLDIYDNERMNQIEAAIEYALDNDTFEVYYHPIFESETGKIVSAEALLRLDDPLLGSILPAEFIAIAEKSGNIFRIGRFVFESVCKLIKEENIAQKGIKYVAINLSVVQCMQQKLVEELVHIIDKYGVDKAQIVLEITETVANYAPEMMTINIHKLSELGIGLALDDYGTGCSNMNFMLEMPFNIVKIDKSIVWYSFENKKAMIALTDTIAMIRDLGMEIVVEGVETQEHVDKLSEIGCEYLQGYYFAKAIPKNEFLIMLNRRR